MGRNASLTDFDGDESTVEPIAAVQTFHPEGVACPGCDEQVNELWLVDGTRRCRTCREW